MKHFYLYLTLVILGCFFCSCNQEALEYEEPYDHNEVVFRASGIDAEVQTKATAVTDSDLTSNGFNASCVTGSAGSDTAVWSNIAFAKSGSYWKGGKYWPTSNPSYRFYAVYPKTYTMTAATAGATISASNAHDIVCAYASSSTYKSANTLTFNHIFARLGKVTVSAGSGYTISGITINIVPKTGGTYNLRTGAWSSTSKGSPTNIANSTPGTKSNDIYLVPGTYTLDASWTAANGSYTETFSNKHVNITLVEGKVNNITCTLSGNNVNEPIGVFTVNASGKTVGFAPGNLQCTISGGPDATGYNWTGSNWCFAENQWDYLGDMIDDNMLNNNTYQIGVKKDLFCRVATGGSYNSYGLCSLGYSYRMNTTYFGSGTNLRTDWGSIPEVQTNCGYGWYTPPESEMSYIVKDRTTGVTLNGTDNARFTYATIRTDATAVTGLILIPDNFSADIPVDSGDVVWRDINVGRGAYSTQCTVAGWELLEEAGCVFLPAAGQQRSALSVNDTQYSGCYWTGNATTSLSGGWGWYLYFTSVGSSHLGGGSVNWLDSSYNCYGYSVRLIKQVNL